MRNKMYFIFLIASFVFTPQIFAAKLTKSPISKCEALVLKTLTPSGKSFQYRAFWKDVKDVVDPSKKKDINGLLILLTANYFEQNLTLPTADELSDLLIKGDQDYPTSKYLDMIRENGLSDYFQERGAPENIDQVFALAVKALPHKFEAIKNLLTKYTADFMTERLRPPSDLDLSQKFLIDADLIPLLIGDADQFMEDVKSQNTEKFTKIQDKLAMAYLRFLSQKDQPDHKKVRGKAPTLEDLLISLSKISHGKPLEADISAERFSINDLMGLVGQPSSEVEQDPNRTLPQISVLQNGISDVESIARIRNPSAFKGFLPEEVYSQDRIAALLNAIENKPGLLMTSVNAGMPINEEQLTAMLKYAEDRDFDILIFPTSQILDGLDKRLINNPRIHIVTHTLENAFLKISNIPILAKNQNALASLDGPKQFKPGQTVIVGHSQLSHFNVATNVNHIRQTGIWSTGSLSQNLYPYRHPVQGRTSNIAKNNHTNGFLVMEKADLDAGPFQEGAQNFWHTRPVTFNDDRKFGGVAGFDDLGKKYYVQNGRAIARTSKISTLVLGDLHEAIADQMWIQNFMDFLKAHPEIEKVVLHDPIDGLSHNRHEAKQLSLLLQKFERGEMDYHKELMGLVQIVNAITSADDDIKVVIADSNHSYWGKALVDSKTETQSVINGKLLAELEHAQKILGFADPLSYLFKGRNSYLESLPAHIRREYDGKATLVSHPDRVEVLATGRNHAVGPSYRSVNINFHGHQGKNGAKPSPRTHASSSENSITGDSHQSYILGNWMSVGTSTPARVGYNDGGYSSWSNSFAVIYEDGSKQLVTYSPLTRTFMQRPNHPVPTAQQFFGNDVMEVETNDNDLVSGEIVDQFSHHLDLLGVERDSPKTDSQTKKKN